MKSFMNKVTKIPSGEGFIDYATMAIQCVNHSPERGFSPEEMLSRLDLIKKLKAPEGDCVMLEDAEAKSLLRCVNEMRWGLLHEDVGMFITDSREMLTAE